MDLQHARISVTDGVAYIECFRLYPRQLVRLLPVNTSGISQNCLRKLTTAKDYASYTAYGLKISDGLWYIRSEQYFPIPAELKISESEAEVFYDIEYFFVRKGQATRSTSSTPIQLDATAVFGTSQTEKRYSVTAGTTVFSHKFLFTEQFLRAHFDLGDPVWIGTPVGNVVRNIVPCFHRPVSPVETGLINDAESPFDCMNGQLLPGISLKANLLTLFRRFFEVQAEAPRLAMESQAALVEAIRLMRDNVENGFPGLSVLAAACNMSVPTLKRKFRSSFATTPEHYYRKLQMEEAELLMKKPGMTVRELALRFGYLSQQSFSTTYNKIKGYFPSSLKRTFSNTN